MKKRFLICFLAVLLCVPFFTACSEKTQHVEYNKISTVGQVPEEIKPLIKHNTLKNVVAFDGRLMKSEERYINDTSRTVLQRVVLTDVFGKELAAYEHRTDKACYTRALTTTADGGFMFVLSHDGTQEGLQEAVPSRFIRCEANGRVQFDTTIEYAGCDAIDFCFEKNEKYYIFGEVETPETKVQGVNSPTDIYMAVIDKKGVIGASKRIAGSDYDYLHAVEIIDGQFVLSISSQSKDGDFENSGSDGTPVNWVMKVDDLLEITDKKIENGRESWDVKIGEKDGKSIYLSDPILKDYDLESPKALIDYGDYYVIISENITGQYEDQPSYISSIWYYTETVYSGYNENGELIFRDSVDSSPDFDKLAKEDY